MTEQKIAPVLSDDERMQMWEPYRKFPVGSINDYASAIEQAVLARVGAVQCQVPTEWVQKGLDLAEKLGAHQHGTAWIAMYDHLMSAPDAIRVLKGTPAAAVADDGSLLRLMKSAFRITEQHGHPEPGKRQFNMVFKFRSSEDMNAAEDEWTAFAASAHPQPSTNPGPLAAVEQETIYQVKFHDDVPTAWHDATESAYSLHPEKARRIVFAAIAASKEGASHGQ